MIDREKVISELKEGIDLAIHRCHCGLAVTMEMALALLEAQESIEPILALNDGEHKLWQCGNCKVAVFTRDTKYCHNCGKVVKWDDCGRETTLEKDGHHIRCLNCGVYWCDNDREGNPFPMIFCPNCGRKVKSDDT